MKNWSVRSRIIGGFAAVIAIMVALSALSYIGLRTIRAEATQIEQDILPGVVISAQVAGARARAAPRRRRAHYDAATRRSARSRRTASSNCSRPHRQNDEAYRATIIDEGDRQLYARNARCARSIHDRVSRRHRRTRCSRDAELRTQLRPPLEEYVKLSDSLFELNRKQGVGRDHDDRGSASRSLWMLGPALAPRAASSRWCSRRCSSRISRASSGRCRSRGCR